MHGDLLAAYTAAGAALGAAPVAGATSIDRPELASLTQRLASLPRLDLSPDATDTAYFNVSVKVRCNHAPQPCEAAQAQHALTRLLPALRHSRLCPWPFSGRCQAHMSARCQSRTWHLHPAMTWPKAPQTLGYAAYAVLRPDQTPRMVCASVHPHECTCMSLSSPARAPGCCTCRLWPAYRHSLQPGANPWTQTASWRI